MPRGTVSEDRCPECRALLLETRATYREETERRFNCPECDYEDSGYWPLPTAERVDISPLVDAFDEDLADIDEFLGQIEPGPAGDGQ